MYEDYGVTTYIELCTFSVVYRSMKIDSNWLKHSVFNMYLKLISEHMQICKDSVATLNILPKTYIRTLENL